jgi:hypothetical protein
MNLTELEKALLAAARFRTVNDGVPFAFEKRIMAQLKSLTIVDEWSWWARGLWRAAAPCVAVMLVLSAWSFYAPGYGPGADLSQDFENTVLAAVQQDQPADSMGE